MNPLADTSATDLEDQECVRLAQRGNRDALEQLIVRHQPWIYNIVLRMVYFPADAEDATQEILIKLLTNLSTFEGKSSFRTWLYRIACNHVLNMKRRRGEQKTLTFSDHLRTFAPLSVRPIPSYLNLLPPQRCPSHRLDDRVGDLLGDVDE